MAREYRVPPSRYLGLPWPKWGETDRLLTLALDLHDRLICPEHGGWAADCRVDHDEREWQVHVDICRAAAAVEGFKAEHAEDLPDGAVVWATLLPPGVRATDPLAYDPERAKAEYEAHQRRFGLA